MPRREGPDAIPLNGGVTIGNEPMPNASLTINDVTNGGKAALFSDEFLTVPAANPVVCDGTGRFSVYVRPGQYSFTVPAGADAMDNVVIGSGASSAAAVPGAVKQVVKAVSLTNIAALSAPATVDGVSLVAGDRVLLVAQSTGAQNGIWVVQAAAWTRPADFESGTTQQPGLLVEVAAGGTAAGSTTWEMTNTSGVVVDTGTPTFAKVAWSKIGYANGGGAVTQATDATTGVTLNTPCGQITTVALTTAAGAEERFTLTDSQIAATDVVVVSTTYNGAGTPAVSTLRTAAGAVDIVVTNLHASAALNAAMVINFAVIKAVAA